MLALLAISVTGDSPNFRTARYTFASLSESPYSLSASFIGICVFYEIFKCCHILFTTNSYIVSLLFDY